MALHTGLMRTHLSRRNLANSRIYEWFLEHATVLVGGRLGGLVTGINKRMHEDIRRRALRKAAKAQ